jgi:hypothetical protein
VRLPAEKTKSEMPRQHPSIGLPLPLRRPWRDQLRSGRSRQRARAHANPHTNHSGYPAGHFFCNINCCYGFFIES